MDGVTTVGTVRMENTETRFPAETEENDAKPQTFPKVMLDDRQAAFQQWVREVRNPATANTEGIREIATSNHSASASYEIAQLPDGTWAIRMGCEYRCGNYHGRSIPWTRYSTRQDSIDFFLKTARHHFDKADHDASDRQKGAQVEMKTLLANSLFGFLEPEPSACDTNRLTAASRLSSG